MQHSQTCNFSSDVQRVLLTTDCCPSCTQSCLKFLNRWISPPCLQANWLYPSCSLNRPQPSLPSLYSYHFEEVHNKFPLFEPAWKESAQLVSNSPYCWAADSFLLYGLRCKGSGQIQGSFWFASCCCVFFPFWVRHVAIAKKCRSCFNQLGFWRLELVFWTDVIVSTIIQCLCILICWSQKLKQNLKKKHLHL